jgi:1-acyl-sn-glycerol-3-phosphate acyltransferase
LFGKKEAGEIPLRNKKKAIGVRGKSSGRPTNHFGYSVKMLLRKTTGRSPLLSFPFLGKFLKNIDADIAKFGLSPGIAKAIDRTGNKFTISGFNSELREILRKKPGIIIANHPYQIEFLPLLSSLPKRKDVYLVASYEVLGVCPNFDKHLIPVYVKHIRPKDWKQAILNKFLTSFNFSPVFSYEEAHQKNIQSIKKAGEMVNRGSLAIIFPEAGSRNGRWRRGLGYLIKNLKRKDIYLIKAYIQGSSYFDLLRVIPGLRKLLPLFKVTFAKAEKLTTTVKTNLSAQEITAEIESQYKNWIARF